MPTCYSIAYVNFRNYETVFILLILLICLAIRGTRQRIKHAVLVLITLRVIHSWKNYYEIALFISRYLSNLLVLAKNDVKTVNVRVESDPNLGILKLSQSEAAI